MAIKFLNTVQVDTDVLYVDAANDRVGIGTTSPSTELSVRGAISAITSDYVQGTTGSRLLMHSAGTGNSHSYIQAQSSGGTSNGEDLALQLYGGNVGIGTDSPTAKLHIKNPTTSSYNLRFIASDGGDMGGWYQDGGNNSELYLKDGSGVFKVALNSSGSSYLNGGNVGIGATSPSATLDIVGSGLAAQFRVSNTEANATTKYGAFLGRHYTNSEENITGMLITSNSSSTGGTVSIGGGISSANAVNNIILYTAANNTTLTGTERMRITSAGNVGIGTTSPNTLLDVSSGNFGATAPTVRITNTLNVGNWSGVTSDLGRFEFFTDDTSGNAPYTLGYIGIKNDITTGTPALPSGAMVFATTTFNASGGAVERMRISSTGDVGIGTTNPSEKLEVDGNLAVSNSVAQLYINSQASSDSVINFRADSVQKTKIGWDNSNDSFSIVVGSGSFSTADVVVKTNGDVGIGTTIPSEKLEITGSTPTAGDTTLNLKVPAGNITIGVTEMGNILFSSSDASTGGTGSVAKISTIAGDGAGAWTGNGRPTDLAFFTQPLGASATLVESMRIDQDGNLGIGTTSPVYKLSVNGTIQSDLIRGYTYPNNSFLDFDDDQSASSNHTRLASIGRIAYLADTNANEPVANAAHEFFTGTSDIDTATSLMIIETNGNVGIGNTNPSDYSADANNLVVGSLSGNNGITILSTASSGYGSLYFADATTGNKVYSGFIRYQQNQSIMTFGTNEVERMRIDVNGNVGIGTTSPAGNLHVVGASGNSGRIYLSDKDNGGGGADALLLVKTGINSYIYNRDSGDLRLGTNNQFSYVTIKPTGNVGIGTTGPGSLLEVKGPTNSTTSNLLRLVREVDSSQPHKVAAFYSGVNERGSITINSFVTAYNTSSDYRLKENIKSIDNSVDRLMSLNPCSFNFKSKDKNKLVIDGFIAHEAQEVVPEAVTGLKDAIDKNGDPIYQGIDQSKLIPLLTAALQEAIERIKALENKINK